MPAPTLGSLGLHPGLTAYHGDPGRLLHVGLWRLCPPFTLVWLPVLKWLHNERKKKGMSGWGMARPARVPS